MCIRDRLEGSTESMFEIGDKVVYGVVGVCEVENIDTPPIKGISCLLYTS